MEAKKKKIHDKTQISEKKLFRSKTDVIVAGVAAGIADYFDIDVSIIRLLFVLSIFFGGFGVPLYVILWIVLPSHSDDSLGSSAVVNGNIAEMKEKANGIATDFRNNKQGRTRNVIAVILIIFGVVFLLDNLGIFRGDIFWPALLIIAGLFFFKSK